MRKLTSADFVQLLGRAIANSERCKANWLLSELNDAFEGESFSKEEAALFLGAMATESDRFRHLEEQRVLPGYDEPGEQYQGRLGNDQGELEDDDFINDGSRFRGRGVIQLTGRQNYTSFSEWANDDLVLTDPEVVAEDPYYATYCAVWYWFNYKGEDTGRTCRDVARDTSRSMTQRARGVNSIIFRGEEVPTGSISHWEMRLKHSRRAAEMLGLAWD